MLELLRQPWHWSISGLLIGLTVPILLILGNKSFGISSTLRQVCAACVPANIDFFKYDWRKDSWNLFFVVGIVLGGFIGNSLLSNPNEIVISAQTKQELMALGGEQGGDYFGGQSDQGQEEAPPEEAAAEEPKQDSISAAEIATKLFKDINSPFAKMWISDRLK